MGRGGVEPPTSRLSGVRSNHLSYRPNPVRPSRFATGAYKYRPADPVLVEPIGIEPMTY